MRVRGLRPRRARVDPRQPAEWATSDRNGMIGQQVKLKWQYDWNGNTLKNKRILIHEDELDKPQRQLGNLVLPADPVPIHNPRVEQYLIDEEIRRVDMDGVQRIDMSGNQRIASNLQD